MEYRLEWKTRKGQGDASRKVLRDMVDIDTKLTNSIEGKYGILQKGTSRGNKISLPGHDYILSLLARVNCTHNYDWKTGDILADVGSIMD
jgi:hypothetical protein